jgi:uncharacterized membrane protein
LFGLIACLLLDLIQNWRIVLRPYRELAKLMAVILVSLVLGLFMPGVDNFSHFGGFVMGLLSGLVFMPTIHFGKWDKRQKRFLTIAAIPVIIVFFVGLLTSFYRNQANDICGWCKYLNCVPIGGLCDYLK